MSALLAVLILDPIKRCTTKTEL